MNKNRFIWIALVAVALSLSLSSCGLHGKPRVPRKARASAALPPRAATASAQAGEVGAPGQTGAAAALDASASVIAPGIVEPWGGQVNLSAQEPGWISAIVVNEGDLVKAGQLLATLEDGAQRRALDLARAELAEAEAGLAKTERGATPEELRQARADLEASVARRDFARAAAARTARLKDSGSMPEIERDRTASEAAAQTALAQRAEARLLELTRGARGEDRDAVRAQVEAARARLKLAEANLARRRVIAPAPGTVLLSRFHVGEFYVPNEGPLFVLGDLTRVQVRLEVDEIDALEVRPGATCALYSDGEELVARGIVVRLAPRMGRRALPLESPTARADVRVRETFVEVPANAQLVPGQRVWGHTPRINRRSES